MYEKAIVLYDEAGQQIIWRFKNENHLLRRFLGTVKMEAPGRQILLVAPISFQEGFWVPDDRFIEESEKLPGLYCQLAEELDVWFADANRWGVTLADDGVHFTKEGHKAFAEGLTKTLKMWYSIR